MGITNGEGRRDMGYTAGEWGRDNTVDVRKWRIELVEDVENKVGVSNWRGRKWTVECKGSGKYNT